MHCRCMGQTACRWPGCRRAPVCCPRPRGGLAPAAQPALRPACAACPPRAGACPTSVRLRWQTCVPCASGCAVWLAVERGGGSVLALAAAASCTRLACCCGGCATNRGRRLECTVPCRCHAAGPCLHVVQPGAAALQGLPCHSGGWSFALVCDADAPALLAGCAAAPCFWEHAAACRRRCSSWGLQLQAGGTARPCLPVDV